MKTNILITGASSCIAAEVQNLLTKLKNIKIYLTYNSEKIERLSNAEVFQADFSCRSSLSDFCKAVKDKEITHYIQMQGNTFDSQSIEKVDFENLDKTMDVNLNSTIMILKAILPGMRDRQYGRIVLMNTASSKFGGGFNSFSYGLSKHSVEFLTKYLAKNYTSYNILSNCVSPGLIETGFHQKYQKKI